MQDDEVMCIQDIRPVATHHYLIIPKIHIQNAKTLRPEDETLCELILNKNKNKKTIEKLFV